MSADGLVQLARPAVPRDMGRVFASPDVFLPAWMPACASRSLRARPRRISFGPVDVVVWRDGDGVPRAFEARCPHLGADLGMGRVVDGQLRCAIHHWRFRGDGSCAHATDAKGLGRSAPSFPVVERHGLVFVWPSRTAPPRDFPALPDGDDRRAFRTVVLPSTTLACHHHLTTANGLDAVHFEALHDLVELTPWRHDVDEEAGAVHLHLHHRHRSRRLYALFGELRSRFSAHGPSIAWVTAIEPVRMHALFCTRPERVGSSSRAVLFFPRGGPVTTLRAARVVGFLFSLLGQDGQMLDALRDFRPAFVDTDAPLRDYAALLERWPR